MTTPATRTHVPLGISESRESRHENRMDYFPGVGAFEQLFGPGRGGFEH